MLKFWENLSLWDYIKVMGDSVIRDFSKLCTIPLKFDRIMLKFWEIHSLLDYIKVMGD